MGVARFSAGFVSVIIGLAAAFETAELLEQLRIFLETGPGSRFPDAARREALVTVSSMRDRLVSVARGVAARPEKADLFWQRW